MTQPQQLSFVLEPPRPTPREAGRAAGQASEDKAVREQRMDASAARAYVLRRLEDGPVPGEELVDGLTREGILRGDARASGPLFSRLSKENVIVCVRADLPRRNGNATSGGRLWALVKRLGSGLVSTSKDPS